MADQTSEPPPVEFAPLSGEDLTYHPPVPISADEGVLGFIHRAYYWEASRG